jgi:hypothetical protein
MKPFINILSVILITACYPAFNTQAQTQDQGHLFTMTMLRVPESDMMECLDFFEKEAKPIDAENEYILSEKVFTHLWGPEWTICILTEYKDWEGFIAADKKWTELFEKKYPDKSQRTEIFKKFSTYLNNHTDAIVSDNPKLQK